MTSCLSDDAIADIATPESAPLSADIIAHLAACLACRERFSGATSAFRDDRITAEIQRVEKPVSKRPARRVQMAVLAAAVGGLLLMPVVMRDRKSSATRELRDDDGAITKTTAPSIIAPRGVISPASSLLWTAVPGADRYEVTVFSADGVVVWNGESPDTAMPLPVQLRRSVRYLWKVRARTGFDRWTESDLLEFTIPSCQGSSC